MSAKPAIKLFSWKKGAVIIGAGIGAVAYRTYESYQQKGKLDWTDWVAAIGTVAMLFSVTAIVGWWANREER